MQEMKEMRFNPWVRKTPLEGEWKPTPVFLPVKSHGQRNLVGYSSQSYKELTMTERLNTHSLDKQKVGLVWVTFRTQGSLAPPYLSFWDLLSILGMCEYPLFWTLKLLESYFFFRNQIPVSEFPATHPPTPPCILEASIAQGTIYSKLWFFQ